ncbi:MAG: radical SAM protein, partial [Anaerotignum sp.]
MDKIGLYIHIPFCRQKCLYCDFPSFAGKEGRMQAYVDALTAEIKSRGKEYHRKKVVSVFFGGGTPTVLPIPMLEQLMQAVFESWDVAEDAEITTEANPGTLDEKMADALKKMGFNRLSMGVQAWQ